MHAERIICTARTSRLCDTLVRKAVATGRSGLSGGRAAKGREQSVWLRMERVPARHPNTPEEASYPNDRQAERNRTSNHKTEARNPAAERGDTLRPPCAVHAPHFKKYRFDREERTQRMRPVIPIESAFFSDSFPDTRTVCPCFRKSARRRNGPHANNPHAAPACSHVASALPPASGHQTAAS